MFALEIRLEVLFEPSLLLLLRLLHRIRESLLTASRGKVALLGRLVHSDLLHRGRRRSSPTIVGVVITRTAAAVAAVRHPSHADHAAATASSAREGCSASTAAVGGDRVTELDHGPGRHSRAAQDGLRRRGRRRTPGGWRSTATRPRVPSRISFAFIEEYYFVLQGDHSACGEPPVDFKAKVPFWPGLAWPSQTKAEHLFCSQREDRHKLNGHPVHSLCYQHHFFTSDRLTVTSIW